MRVTKRTNIAIRVLIYCAVHSDRLVTKAEIAHQCNASENHLGQVVNQLGQMDFLTTFRGRNGGFRLARSPRDISLGDVFRCLESPDPINDFFDDFTDTCSEQAHDALSGAVRDAAEKFYCHLDGITVASLLNQERAKAQLELVTA